MADPTADLPDGLRQPDRRTCGAACLVVAEALANPRYAAAVATPAGFRAEVLAMHRRVTSPVDVRGRWQLPWPAALGTPPWAVAAQLAGTTGVPHRSVLLRGRDLGAAYDGLAPHRLPAALYVGSGWLPRHVVLLLEVGPESMRVYEPAAGRIEWVLRHAFVDARLDLAGWDVPWFLVAR